MIPYSTISLTPIIEKGTIQKCTTIYGGVFLLYTSGDLYLSRSSAGFELIAQNVQDYCSTSGAVPRQAWGGADFTLVIRVQDDLLYIGSSRFMSSSAVPSTFTKFSTVSSFVLEGEYIKDMQMYSLSTIGYAALHCLVCTEGSESGNVWFTGHSRAAGGGLSSTTNSYNKFTKQDLPEEIVKMCIRDAWGVYLGVSAVLYGAGDNKYNSLGSGSTGTVYGTIITLTTNVLNVQCLDSTCIVSKSNAVYGRGRNLGRIMSSTIQDNITTFTKIVDLDSTLDNSGVQITGCDAAASTACCITLPQRSGLLAGINISKSMYPGNTPSNLYYPLANFYATPQIPGVMPDLVICSGGVGSQVLFVIKNRMYSYSKTTFPGTILECSLSTAYPNIYEVKLP